MTEIMKVKDWDSITNSRGIFYITFKTPEDLMRVAKQYEVPFVFEREQANMAGTNELMFPMGVVIYWFRYEKEK